jgi:hypothetical protein
MMSGFTQPTDKRLIHRGVKVVTAAILLQRGGLEEISLMMDLD